MTTAGREAGSMRRRLGLELELVLISKAEVDLLLRSKRGTEAEDHGREERNNNNNREHEEQAGVVVVVVDDGDADLDRKRLNKVNLLHQLVAVVVVIAMRPPISTTTTTTA